MKNNNLIVGLVGVAVVIAIVAGILALNKKEASVGNTTQSFWDAQQGFKVNGTTVINSSRAATFTGVSIPTAASATTTLVVGGIQTYATSSATSICLFFDTRGATSSFNGTAYWKYGTAPCQL